MKAKKTFAVVRTGLCLIVLSLSFALQVDVETASAQSNALPSGLGTTVAAAPKKKPQRQFVVNAQADISSGRLKPRGKIKVKKPKDIIFTVTPKLGFKAAFLVNGKLVRYQSDKQLETAGRKSVDKKKTLFVSQGSSGKTVKIASVEFTHKLKKVKVATDVKAIFAAYGESFSQNTSISWVGLGSSIVTTNANPAHFEGFAESRVGIQKVLWINLTSSASGTAQGISPFSADIPLVEGDNQIMFSALATDGVTHSKTATVSHSPSADFQSGLSISKDVAIIGKKTELVFRIALAARGTAAVKLLSCDHNGVVTSDLSLSMADDGMLPDEIGADGTYTAKFDVTPTEAGYRYYRVLVERDGSKYLSGWKHVHFAEELSSQTITGLVAIANNVRDRFAALKVSGVSVADASKIVIAELKANPEIGKAGGSTDGNIWWITKERGLLGAYSIPVEGTFGGGAQNGSTWDRSQFLKEKREAPLPTIGMYTPMVDTSQSIDGELSEVRMSAASTTVEERKRDRIKSPYAFQLSPFVANVNYSYSSGSSDPYFNSWAYLQGISSNCGVNAAVAKITDGVNSVRPEDFTQLGEFGIVHIAAHAGIFFEATDDAWLPAWGPRGDLTLFNGLAVINSGFKISQNSDGTYDPSVYADDIIARRLLVTENGMLLIMPSYFRAYLAAMPRSLVVLTACSAMANGSLANTFLEAGAGAVVGYSELVTSSYSNAFVTSLYSYLIEKDLPLDKAIAEAKMQHPPSSLDFVKAVGFLSLRAPLGELENGDFEDSSIGVWKSEGDGRVISGLGSYGPIHGVRTGVVSTGLGYTQYSGQLEQNFCIPAAAEDLVLNWNYFSEEFLEFCGSEFQDWFDVTLCTQDKGKTAAPETCSQKLLVTIDDLCSGVTPTPLHFDKLPRADRPGVYTYGWQELRFSLKDVRDKSARLIIAARDVGDSVFDSAVLVDNIQVTEAEE